MKMLLSSPADTLTTIVILRKTDHKYTAAALRVWRKGVCEFVGPSTVHHRHWHFDADAWYGCVARLHDSELWQLSPECHDAACHAPWWKTSPGRLLGKPQPVRYRGIIWKSFKDFRKIPISHTGYRSPRQLSRTTLCWYKPMLFPILEYILGPFWMKKKSTW